MADVFKTIKVTQATPGGPLQEQLVGAVNSSSGTADAGKVVILDSTGQLDPSMGGGGSLSVNGTPVSNPNLQDSASVTWSVVGSNIQATAVTGSVSFSALTSGNNSTAAMTVSGTASLVYSGSGVVNANEIGGINAAGNSPAHAGQLLISQPGNTTALWADPLVQGLYPIGTAISTPINPVFIGASDGTNLQAILVDGSGNLKTAVENTVSVSGTVTVSSVTNPVTVTGTVSVTQGTSPWVVSLTSTTITGTVAVTQSGSWTVAATQSGTWTVQQGTPPWIVAGNLTHNAAVPGTANVGVLPAVASLSPPTYNAGDQVLLSTDLTGALRVSSGGSFTPALTADRTNTGTITSTQNVLVATAGGGTLLFNVTGTWTGTIVFEASVDGTNFISALVQPFQFGSLVSSTTANGQWLVNTGGMNSFRVRGNTVATGTATVWMEVGAGPNAVTVQDIIQGSVTITNFPATQTVAGNVTATQGSPNTVTNAWPVEVTDGTNILLTSAHPGVVNALQDGSWTVQANTHDGGGTSILSTTDSGTIGLNVHVTNTGGLGGTQYVEGNLIGATGTGTLAIAKNPSNDAEGLHVDASNNLLVSVNTALPTGTNTIGKVEVTDGTNILLTSAHPGITQDLSDGLVGTGTQPTTAMQIAGWDGSNLTVLSTTSNGFLNTNATVSGTFTPALTSDRTSTGTITAASQSVSVSTQGAFSMTFNVTGTWAGTLTPQFLQADGSTWVNTSVYPTLPGGAAVSTITANGQWQTPVGGFQSFRLFATAFTSGTANVSEEVGAGGLSIAVHQGTAANLNATVTQAAGNWNTNLTEVSGSAVSLGQKTSANSIPVVIASDQSSVEVTAQASGANIGYVGYQLPTSSRMAYAQINFSSSGATTVIAGVSGQTVRVWRMIFNVGGSTDISFSDGVTTFSGPMTFSSGGGIVLDFSGDPWYVTGLSNGFELNSTGAVQVGGTIWYTQS